MDLIDRIKWDMKSDEDVIWKYPSDQIRLGSQLIVGEGQEAAFVKGGELMDIFTPGTHTLTTSNIPILNKLVNLPFDDKTPFTAEIWFVSKLTKMDVKWGTKSPIQIMDRELGMPISVRSFGRWGYQVINPSRLIKKIVGSQSSILSNKVSEYLYGYIIQSLSEAIAEKITDEKISVLTIATQLSKLSSTVSEKIIINFENIGFNLINFNIESINIPEDELSSIQSIYKKTLEARELSKAELSSSYAQIKSFEVMNNAASNESQNSMGVLLGAGMGLGIGAPIGQKLGERIGSANEVESPKTPASRLKEAKTLYEDGLISEEQFNAIKERIIREL